MDNWETLRRTAEVDNELEEALGKLKVLIPMIKDEDIKAKYKEYFKQYVKDLLDLM